jgi:hypothetical protein
MSSPPTKRSAPAPPRIRSRLLEPMIESTAAVPRNRITSPELVSTKSTPDTSMLLPRTSITPWRTPVVSTRRIAPAWSWVSLNTGLIRSVVLAKRNVSMLAMSTLIALKVPPWVTSITSAPPPPLIDSSGPRWVDSS